jgi:2-dehydropantoate 2-reductase
MGHKYAKLLVNTANAVEAACGRVSRHGGLAQRAREEAEAVFAAAGIEVAPSEEWQARRGDFSHVDVDGIPRQGGSSWQSLARNAGSIEADYLNGEVVLLGRLHGVATPVNQALQQVANRMARDRVPPGSFAADEIEALITELSRRPG